MNPLERLSFGFTVVWTLLIVLGTGWAIRQMEKTKRRTAAAGAVLFSLALLIMLWAMGNFLS